MSSAPDPAEIFDRAVEEGERRLTQSTGELAATSFIAGFTVVVGIAALGVTHAMVEGGAARIAGALAFAPALVFLVVGRTELFNENFLDPTAAAVDSDDGWLVRPLLRLWVFTFVFNFIGGAILAVFVAVEGALPAGSAEVLATIGEEIANREAHAVFASAVLGGTIVSILSFLLEAVESSGSRIALSYMVGFLLAIGSFDHVVVTGLHLLFGVLFGAPVGYGEVVTTTAIALAGNVVGGLGLVTVSHIEQVRGARDSGL